MKPHFDVIVVGVGGVGSAALDHLARRGLRVLGIDRFAPGHDRGSSHGQTRIIRLAYFEHADYVPLLRRAYELWADLEARAGEPLFVQAGLLAVGSPDGPTMRGTIAAAQQHRLAIDKLSRTECHERFPAFSLPEDAVAIFERAAGVLRVERCVQAHFNQARNHGAQVAIGEEVVGWSAVGDDVEVTTDHGVYRADRLILAAGPWSGKMLASLGIPLTVRRKHVYWFPDIVDAYRAEKGCPTFFFETPVGEFYGLPGLDGRGLKAGEHTGGAVVADPLNDDRNIDLADRDALDAFVAAHLPKVPRPSVEQSVCYYTMSPDCHFLVDRHPQCPQVAFAAGLSGHGFKFTGVLGEALADLAMHGASKLPIGFLGIDRLIGRQT